jgi:hypothetical protein
MRANRSTCLKPQNLRENQDYLERVAGIEPAQPAWKAGVLPLNYTRLLPELYDYQSTHNGGGGWIRTTEARASDLQSDPFSHSGTPPSRADRIPFPGVSKAEAAFYGNYSACAIVSQRFSETLTRLVIPANATSISSLNSI